MTFGFAEVLRGEVTELREEIARLRDENESLKASQSIENLFELGYLVNDGGDGSVSVSFFGSEEAAEAEETRQEEEGGYAWGESSVSSKRFCIRDGKILLVKTDWDSDLKRLETKFVPLKVISSGEI